MVRKFAFHMILAGHRFSKAGQVSSSRNHCSMWSDAGAQVYNTECCDELVYDTFGDNSPFI